MAPHGDETQGVDQHQCGQGAKKAQIAPVDQYSPGDGADDRACPPGRAHQAKAPRAQGGGKGMGADRKHGGLRGAGEKAERTEASEHRPFIATAIDRQQCQRRAHARADDSHQDQDR
ncbi:hypothetical protein LTR94_030100, partial [Friedmanniomyces endolithicus]